MIVIGALLLVGVAGLGYLLYVSLQGPTPLAEILGLVEHGHQDRDHVEEEIAAGPLPPVGGSHSPNWQNCGIYDAPVKIENAVHSMEHGAVWLAYQPELAPEAVESLREVVRGEDFVLMSPYPGLQSPIVLTAWQVQLELDDAQDGRVIEFLDRYIQGPTMPERGAPCDGGLGTPIQ